jgi:hypothetical protein
MTAPEDWRFGTRPTELSQVGQTLPVDRPLMVVELADAYIVTIAGDRDDWLVRFARTDGIDAAGWAEHMVQTYNHRLAAVPHSRC